MQCSSCGKSGFVSVGHKRYCSNCGVAIAAAGPAKAMSDIRASTAAADASQISTQSRTVMVSPKPAGQFHGKQVGGGAVLDLRKANLPAATIPSPPVVPEATAAPVNALNIAEPKQPTSIPVAAAANPINTPAPVAPQTSADRMAERLQKAATIPKHPMVQKFGTKAEPPAPPVNDNPLPNLVATHVDAMGQQAEKLEPRAEALQSALAAAKPKKFNLATAASGLAIIAIMGGYIWTQNYPKMAFHSAASRAGFSATLPGYVPSSYRQASPISYRTGEITISFTSPGIDSPLNIIQRRTDWDSNSLKENFVAKQSESYTAVQGQGLTIYLFDKNQASWVNHGVWYTISGAENLSREQILKIAYGL